MTTLSVDEREFAFAIFQVLRDGFLVGNIDLTRATRILNESLVAPGKGWRVIGITPAGLQHVEKANFENAKGLQRAHLFHRASTVREMLARSFKDADEFYEYWHRRDITVLGLRSENRVIENGQYIPFHEVDPNLFFTMNIGFRYKKSIEGIYLKYLLENYRSQNGEAYLVSKAITAVIAGDYT